MSLGNPYLILALIFAVLAPYWCVMVAFSRKNRFQKLHFRQLVLRELVHDGCAKAEEEGYAARKQGLDKPDKQQIALSYVKSVSKDYSDQEILDCIPAILAKVSNAGSSNKVKI